MPLTASEHVRSGVAILAGCATPDGSSLLLGSGIQYGPAKAANAGGVAVSGSETVQDSQRLQWSREEVDNHLQRIMVPIHGRVHDTAEEYEQVVGR